MHPQDDFLELQIDGRTHRIGRVGLEVHFDAVEQIYRLRDERFGRALERCTSLAGEQFEAALRLAFNQHQRIVTNDEVADWLESLEGAAFTFAQALRKFQPDLSEEACRGLYEKLNARQLQQITRFLDESFLNAADQQPTVAADKDTEQ